MLFVVKYKQKGNEMYKDIHTHIYAYTGTQRGINQTLRCGMILRSLTIISMLIMRRTFHKVFMLDTSCLEKSGKNIQKNK